MNASDVLNRLISHRKSQTALVEHLLQEEEKLGQRVRYCGSWLHLREWIESGESRIRNANFCKQFLLCRSCAARRAGKLVTAYEAKVNTLTASQAGLIPAMVTLTIKNRHDLGDGIAHLKASWKSMMEARRKGKSKSGRHALLEWNKVEGAVRAVEITHSDEHGWHPHIHAFCLLSGYIDQKALSAEWERFTGDSFVVGITKCKNGVTAGLIETLKYASKLTELDPAQSLHVHRTAKGSRFTDPFGILRGVPEPDVDEDDAEGLTGPYRDFIASWMFGSESYKLEAVETVPAAMLGCRKTAGVNFAYRPTGDLAPGPF